MIVNAEEHFKFEPSSLEIRWVNVFTGKSEAWVSQAHSYRVMFESAAKLISELQAEIDEIKAMIPERNNITTA